MNKWQIFHVTVLWSRSLHYFIWDIRHTDACPLLQPLQLDVTNATHDEVDIFRDTRWCMIGCEPSAMTSSLTSASAATPDVTSWRCRAPKRLPNITVRWLFLSELYERLGEGRSYVVHVVGKVSISYYNVNTTQMTHTLVVSYAIASFSSPPTTNQSRQSTARHLQANRVYLCPQHTHLVQQQFSIDALWRVRITHARVCSSSSSSSIAISHSPNTQCITGAVTGRNREGALNLKLSENFILAGKFSSENPKLRYKIMGRV